MAASETTPAKAFDVHCGDVRIRGYDYGSEGARPLILLHGVQDFALSLDGLARELRPRFRVVTYDLRGHGDSDKPGAYTLGHHVADLHAMLAAVGGARPVLVGHSLGGQVVSQYAGIFDEVPKCVISIDGLGPPTRNSELPADFKKVRARKGIETLLKRESYGRPMRDLEQAVRLYRQNHPGLTEQHARDLVEQATQPHPDGGFCWKWDRRVLTTFLSFAPSQIEERWGWITCPALLITAGRSLEFWNRRRRVAEREARMDPDELTRRLACFRDVTHVEIADAGHMIHYDAPAELAEAITTFLEDHAALEPGERDDSAA